MANANVKAVISAEDRASGVIAGVGNSFGKLTGAFALGQLAANGVTKAFDLMGQAAKSAISQTASFEQTRIGLENMLGSADKARTLLGQINKFAAETPFEFPELAQATRQLVAFGFSAEEAFDTMKQLGDVSAAVGAPINDLAYLMGTLRAQGRAFTIDIRQFAMRGIPIYEYLAKVFKTNTQEVTKLIEAGKVGFPEVQQAFQMMTAEGGKFHNTMAKQSKSLNGLFSTLKDTLGLVGRNILGMTNEGDVVAGGIFDKMRNGIAGFITAINNNMPKILEFSSSLVGSLGNAIGIVSQKFVEFLPTLVEFGRQIFEYLQPKVVALWNSFKELLPTLQGLFEEVIKPMIPVLGQTFVVALGLLVDALNVLVTVLKPVVEWFKENERVTQILIGTIGALYLMLKAQEAFTAFQASLAALRTSFAITSAALSAPIMITIAIAAALVALELIRQKSIETWNEIDKTERAFANMKSAQSDAKARLENLARNGTPTQQATAREQLRKGMAAGTFASGTDFFRGGMATINERGAENVILPRGSKVIPADKSARMNGEGGVINININAGAFTGSRQDARRHAETILEAIEDIRKMRGGTGVGALA